MARKKQRTLLEELTGVTADYATRSYKELLDQAYSYAATAARGVTTSAGGSVRSLYAELGLLPEATDEVVEAAYRALAKRFHPDSQIHPDPERMARISAAHREIRRLRKGVG